MTLSAEELHRVRRERAEQGLGPTVTDVETLSRLASVLRSAPAAEKAEPHRAA